MNVELLRLLFDFGLLVLIWLVQLVIYPSFLHYVNKELMIWNKIYTVFISLVLIPLMFGQLVTAVFQFFKMANTYSVAS